MAQNFNDFMEDATGLDLDGDGDVGGWRAQRTKSAISAASSASAQAYLQVRSRKSLPDDRLNLITAPESWAEEQQTCVNGHAVSSALEVAGNDVNFPATGATVRAVPAKPKPPSRPGDTFWKGASGRKPPRIGDAVQEESDDEGGIDQKTVTPMLEAPPDIMMHCRDGDETVTVRVTWDMSWSDVLDQLKTKFGRAVIFEYVNHKHVRITCDDEDAFDIFCSDSEKYGCQASVDIITATLKVSSFIADAPRKQPFLSRDNMDNEEELDGIVQSTKRRADKEGVEALLEEDGQGKGKKRKEKGLLDRMADAPYPLTHMLMLGGNGFLLSLGAVVLGFFIRWNTLSAVSAALTCHLFGLAFFVSEVEDGASQLVRLGLGFCGFHVAILCIACYSVALEYVGIIAAFLLLLASFWYVELCVKARGWESWYQGFINLWGWMKGGCPLVGIRKPEPQETIVVIGPEPKPTVFTMLMPVEERHPGVEWKMPKEGMKVKHIGQCLQVLSEQGNPMGPWEEGIIHKKTARQLRKWLVRLGKKTEEDFKKWKKLPHGEIIYIGFVSSAMHCLVEWQDDSMPKDEKKKYYQYGENGYYELVEFQELEGPAAGKYDDNSVMHTGGSQLLMTKTFLAYFARRFCAWLWYWIIFFSYFGMLYLLEYTLANYAAYQALGSEFQIRGKKYNVVPGNKFKIHMHCKGGTKKAWDGRPPVIFESMEGLGQGIYMSGLQDKIAETGVCCVYDRLGFGHSSSEEASNIWKDRTPKQIASELMYALTVAVDDTPLQNPVSFEKPYIGSNGENLTEYIKVTPPFVLVAHSAGALYARQFAHDYPKLVAGMVLVDPLPTEQVGGAYIRSAQHNLLSPLRMQLCERFLEPVGLIYNFAPAFASAIFPSSVIAFEMNGGTAKTSKNYEAMLSRMLRRQWCPSVLAEYEGLYTAGGIETVVEADKAGYDTPTILWIRDSSLLGDAYSSDKIYRRRSELTETSGLPLERNIRPSTGVTGEIVDDPSEIQRTAVLGARRSLRRQAANTTKMPKCPDCTMSWDDLMRNLNKQFRNSYTDPFTGKKDIMKGEFQSCAARGCHEYAIITNPVEIYEAVTNVWNKVGHRTNFTSDAWHMELYSWAQDFNAVKFRSDLADLLRHVSPSDVVILKGPTQVQEPLEPVSEKPEPGCVEPSCYPGYTGSSFGLPRYLPKSNKGVISLSIQIIGQSQRAVDFAQNNLRATEDTNLDKTGKRRRAVFLHKWRVLWVAEDKCSQIAGSERVCQSNTIDLFSATYSSPVYGCPQNTYQVASDGRCKACEAARTSATDSKSKDACLTCQPSFDQASGLWKYTYLKCDGKGCNQCPPATISSPGALGLQACVIQPSIVVTLKGPSDQGTTSEAVTAHRYGRPVHKAFDATRFQQVVSIISGIQLDRVLIAPPKDVWNFTSSRCRELRGGCMFDVGIQLQARDGDQLQIALERIRGDECYDASAICRFPDINKTAIYGRSLLLNEFEVLKMREIEISGRDSGECPDRYIVGERTESLLDIFKEKGKHGVPLIDAAIVGTYECPSKFYKNMKGYCDPCPDMTTSDAGAKSVSDCVPFNTVIMAAKDASLTYEARTNENVNGYTNAQPSALAVMNYSSGTDAYIKIRGYALLPDQRVDETNILKGFQIVKCEAGLNCFNESGFREDISILVGTVMPNEVRLVKPNSCLFANPETAYDGQQRGLPRGMQQQKMCGPWPGLTPTPGKCVCRTNDVGMGRRQRCFYTAGPGVISPHIGSSARGVFYGSDALVSDVKTAGECAKRMPDGGTAFLYHPSKMLCSTRNVERTKLAKDLCSSHSPECRDLSKYMSDDVNFWSKDLLIPGMQMYFEAADTQCKVVVEDSVTETPQGYRCSERLQSPLDTLYYLINLHAETKTDLEHAMRVLRGEQACVHDADCLAAKGGLGGTCVENKCTGESGLASKRATFMKTYRITELAVAPDKTPTSTSGAVNVERETSTVVSGNFDKANPLLLESTALCGSDVSGYTSALCMKGSVVDQVQPEATCKWFYSETLRPEVKAQCQDGAEVTCLGSNSGEPRCVGQNLLDEASNSSMPVPCMAKSFDLGMPQSLCAGVKLIFKDLTAVSQAGLCKPYTGFECFKPTEMLITRVVFSVNVGESKLMLASQREPPMLLLSFSDGSDQLVTLTVAENERWTYYIRPVVTRFVTVRGYPRSDGVTIRINYFEAFGQAFSSVFDGETYVDIFRSNYVAEGSRTHYACPATTYANSYVATDILHSVTFTGCSVCPYPTGSDEGSDRLSNCTCPSCGDGRVFWQGKEQCDDGNLVVNDGCSPDCNIEELQLCQGKKDGKGVGLPLHSYSSRDQCFRVGSSWTGYGKASWPARYGHGAVIHRGTIWLVGGISTDATKFFNDVWFEDTNGAGCVAAEPEERCDENNGLNWIASRSGYPSENEQHYKEMMTFPPRGYHGLLDHGGFIWVLGGAHRKNWPTISQSQDAEFCSPAGTGEYDCTFNEAFNDVWKTQQGATSQTASGQYVTQWTHVPQGLTMWEGRYQHAVVSFKGSMWVIGGASVKSVGGQLGDEPLNDLWRSTNDEGNAWEKLGGGTCHAATDSSRCMTPRQGHAATVDPDGKRIMVFGGLTRNVYLNDVWYYEYSDASNGECENLLSCWIRLVESAPWGARYLHRSLVYQKSLWIIGGQRCTSVLKCKKLHGKEPEHLGDIWVSSGKELDAKSAGEKWNQAASQAGWGKRSGHSMVVFDTRGFDPPKKNARSNLWILGGMDGYNQAHNQTSIAFQF